VFPPQILKKTIWSSECWSASEKTRNNIIHCCCIFLNSISAARLKGQIQMPLHSGNRRFLWQWKVFREKRCQVLSLRVTWWDRVEVHYRKSGLIVAKQSGRRCSGIKGATTGAPSSSYDHISKLLVCPTCVCLADSAQLREGRPMSGTQPRVIHSSG
jgi:hypothetical protein